MSEFAESESILDDAAAPAVPPSAPEAAPFYVVGTRKFTVMFVFTFGLYATYWMYKQWACYRDSLAANGVQSRPWPVMRAIFSIFYFHSLFAKVRRHAAPLLDDWEYRTHATILALLVLAERVLDKLSGKEYSDWDTAGLILMLPLWYFYFKAQQLINQACGDPAGTQNARLTGANYAWIAGAFVFLAGIVALNIFRG